MLPSQSQEQGDLGVPGRNGEIGAPGSKGPLGGGKKPTPHLHRVICTSSLGLRTESQSPGLKLVSYSLHLCICAYVCLGASECPRAPGGCLSVSESHHGRGVPSCYMGAPHLARKSWDWPKGTG